MTKPATPLTTEDRLLYTRKLEADRARLIELVESIDPVDHNLYERACTLLRELEAK